MTDAPDHGLTPSPHRPEIPGRPQTVAAVLEPVLADAPDRPALVGRHGRYSYGELDREANRAARALAALGVEPGDRVAACLPNDAAIAVAFLGAMRLGALWVGVNRPLAPPEKAYLLEDAGARVFLATPEVAREVGSRVAAVETVVVDPSGADDAWAARIASEPALPLGIPLDPWGPAAIAYTSGTTGFPKGAVHSQHNLLLPGAVSAAQRSYPPDVPQGVVLPLTILNLMILGPVLAWQHRACSVVMDRIDAVGVAEWVESEKIGSFAAVPTLIHDLMTHPDVRPEQLTSLTRPMVGGAECPEEFRALYRERFGAEVSIGYGMTEAPTAVTRGEAEPGPTPGYCGRALPQVSLSIRDEAGAPVASGVEGEICVEAASDGSWAGIYTPMLGYWGKPEATAEALAGGVYHTGDIGVLETDGTLYIRGRRNELILRGGANVYPAEVERVLQEHPAVAEGAVLGIPDQRLGERVVAAVVLESGAEVGAAELREHCLASLARYKVPDRIAVVGAMPRNAMSKVVKRDLLSNF